MLAVPKLPMISFDLKTSPEAVSFQNLKQCIAEYYHEDPSSYANEFLHLEQLRGLAVRPRIDLECVGNVKRYYAQLHSLQNRFPLSSENEILNFIWKEIYSGSVWQSSNIKYEMAAVLYNIGSLHSKLGAEEARTNPESMKVACTHYQCAAWAYGQLKDAFSLVLKGDLSPELLVFEQQICFAQAQECILEKSLTDNRKPGIIAKVTAQVINYYNLAITALFNQSEDCNIQELVGSKLYKEWLKYIKFKVSYLSSVLLLYQGLHAEEQKKMGQRITLFNAAVERLEEARKEAKGMANQELIQDVLTQTSDVILGKQKNAKSENDFIYHEEVPDISTISAVQGANLVSGVGFDVSDGDILGEDIFKRLIPMKTHESSSLYSEEKATILRSIGTKIEDRDVELNSYMSSLNMDSLNSLNSTGVERLPTGIVDRCAELSAKPDAIPNLVQSMSNLAESCAEVETMLNEIRQMLDEEGKFEKDYQKQVGPRPQGGHISELNREFNKYLEAHNKAGESNDTLRKAMELHVNNLKILSRPLVELQDRVPRLSESIEESTVRDLKLLLSKVQEMKDQRAQLFNDLREAVNKDDITSKLVAHGDKNVQELFDRELKKYKTIQALIDQNLEAQNNILKALTDTYAKYAPLLKQINDVRLKKEQFYSSLQASFDVYEDLLLKSSKGLEFYKKLQGNVQKLVSRVKAARDVQDEERQQMLKTMAPKLPPPSQPSQQIQQNPQSVGGGPKLKDYLKSGMFPNLNTGVEDKVGLPERPTPLGQENVATTCTVVNPGAYYANQAFYPNAMGTMGYTNPIYQNPYYSSSNMGQKKSDYPQQPSPALSQSSDSSTKSFSYGYPMPTQQHSYNPSGGYPQNNWPAVTTGNQTTQAYYNSMTSPTQQTPSYSFGTQPGTTVSSNQALGSYAGQNQVQYPGNYQGQQFSTQSQSSGTTQQNTGMNYPQNNQYFAQNTANNQQSNQNSQNNQQYPSNQQNSNYSYTNPQNPYQNPQSNVQQTPQNPVQQTQQNPYQNPQSPAQQAPQNPVQQTSQNYYQNPQKTPQNPVQQIPQNSYPNSQQTPQYPAQQTLQNSGQQAQQNPYQNPQNPAQKIPQNSNNFQNPYFNQFPAQNQYAGAQQTTNYQNPQNTVQQNPQNPVQQQNPTQQMTGQQTNPVSQPQPNYYQNYQYGSNPYYQGQYQPTSTNQNYSNTPTVNSLTSYSNAHNVQAGQTQVTHSNYTANVQQAQPQQQTQQPATNYQNLSDCKNDTRATSTITNHAPGQPTFPTQSQTKQITSPVETPKKQYRSENMDLLSGIDFSIASPSIETVPTLQPQTIKTEPMLSKNEDVLSEILSPKLADPTDRKSSVDNLSNCSDISSIDQNFDWESVSVKQESPKKTVSDPFDNPNVLKLFHKEVERMEKFFESLTIKTLSGVTPLDNKWKELQDLLVKDEANRSVSVAKLFPDKNRSIDCLPYDHARVLLPTTTDNYINAVSVKDLGPDCPSFILTQTPLSNTVNDFWEMVWSQKSNTLVCLHTPNEILDTFWPEEINQEKSYGDFAIVLMKQFDLSHCVERSFKVTKHGSDIVMNISLLQIKTWKKSSADHILGIASNVITSYKQQNLDGKSKAPVTINCLTGAERSGIAILAITAILATQSKRPVLINIVDVWYRICSQRKGALNDVNVIKQSLQIVMNNAHNILNKRGIMTSYQMRHAEKTPTVELMEETVRDPLLELDPLWKFK